MINLNNNNGAFYVEDQYMGDNYHEDITFLNINPPTWPHDDVEMFGNKKTLLLIKEAIEKCLEANEDVNIEVFDTNGEGYNFTVGIRDMSKQIKEYEYNLEDESNAQPTT